MHISKNVEAFQAASVFVDTQARQNDNNEMIVNKTGII